MIADASEQDDEYAEDLIAAGYGPRLPDWVEEHMAREREWWRLVRQADGVEPA